MSGDCGGEVPFWKAFAADQEAFVRRRVCAFDLGESDFGERGFGFADMACRSGDVEEDVWRGRIVWRERKRVREERFGPGAAESVVRKIRTRLGAMDAMLRDEKAPPRPAMPKKTEPGAVWKPQGGREEQAEPEKRRTVMPAKRTELNERGRRLWEIVSQHMGKDNAISAADVAALMKLPKTRIYQVVNENKRFFPQPLHSARRAGYWVVEGEAKGAAPAAKTPAVKIPVKIRVKKEREADLSPLSVYRVSIVGPGFTVEETVSRAFAVEMAVKVLECDAA